MKIIRIKESEIKSVLSQIIKENEMQQSNYMFFSNLEQIERQCKLLRNVDPSVIDEILNNGHDWADDHITEAKVNLDQVFDFIMNETRGASADEEPVNADMDQFSMNEEENLNEECWEGYKRVGSKMKNGKKVPNCVPVNEAAAKAKFDVYPSAYANGWAAKNYKSKGGGWKKCK